MGGPEPSVHRESTDSLIQYAVGNSRWYMYMYIVVGQALVLRADTHWFNYSHVVATRTLVCIQWTTGVDTLHCKSCDPMILHGMLITETRWPMYTCKSNFYKPRHWKATEFKVGICTCTCILPWGCCRLWVFVPSLLSFHFFHLSCAVYYTMRLFMHKCTGWQHCVQTLCGQSKTARLSVTAVST